MPVCAVKGCTIGYKSNPEKGHFFGTPKNLELLGKWKNATQRPDLHGKHKICHKHFLLSDILRVRILCGSDGTELGRSPLLKPRLAEGTIPSQFPWTQSPVIQFSPPVNVTLRSEDSFHRPEANNFAQKSSCDDDMDISGSSISPQIITHDNADMESLVSFENLASKVEMPSGWSAMYIRGKHDDVFVMFEPKIRQVDQICKSFVQKEIIVTKDLNLQINVLGEMIDLPALNITEKLHHMKQLEEIMIMLDKANICKGSHEPSEIIPSSYTTVKKDVSDALRHIKCPLIISNSVRCVLCHTVRKTIATRLRRFQSSTTPKRYSLPISPIRRRQVSQMKSKIREAQRKSRKFQSENERLRSELNGSREKLAKYKNKTLIDHFENGNISKNQSLVIKQIFNSAKRKNRNGKRYEEEWMVWCLLLHMRSASEYELLRDHGILPLPCSRTIRRYLSKINTHCGFDPQFFNLLKIALDEKTEQQKHGLLLLDEMKTRESITVDTKTLEYKGLIDMGEKQNSVNFSQKADYGLVIMFQPLADTYTQPIAVFASKGSVKGETLAVLIVRAIILMEQIGAKIHGVIGDSASTNRKFWTTLKADTTQDNLRNYFVHPTDENRKIFLFSDTPHLLKTIRNKLFNHGTLQMHPGKSLIRWEHIRVLHEKDMEQSGKTGKLYCKKLKKEHIELNNSSKMRVRLAAQVFSKSVASGLHLFRHNPELKDSEETEKFCLWVNDMFDALNVKEELNGVQKHDVHYNVVAFNY
uniref:T_2 protein n=1 Tax=Fopius arisanus TaxID=64838 RepID=A0A0C9RM27_9HYME